MTHFQAKILIILLAIIALVVGGAALRATYFISMPLVVGFFIAVLVWPVHEAMRRRLPDRLWWLSTIATMVMIVAVIGGFLGAAWWAAIRIVRDRWAEWLEQTQAQWQRAVAWLEDRNLPTPGEGGNAGDLMMRAGDWAMTAAGGLTEVVTLTIIVLFIVLLMLVEARHWQAKSRASMTPDHARDAAHAMSAVAQQVRVFLLVQAFIAFCTALATGAWLWIMGVPFVLLWMLVTLIVDFVPMIGPTVAGVLMSLVALVTLGWGGALLTAAGILAIQQFFGNYIDPMLKGHRMEISPIVILVSVIFWGWAWGPAGAVVAVPITATLIVASAHSTTLRPIALMLSRTSDKDRLRKTTQHADDGALAGGA